jgi:TonB-dependent SusC/RagA subfamily outer membrane receptor
MTKYDKFLFFKEIEIKKDSLFYLDLSNYYYTNENKNFLLISNTKQVIVADSMITKISIMDLKPSILIDAIGRKEYVGRVVDNKGRPIPFSSLKIVGTSIGVAADDNGIFSIVAKTGQQLTITSVGFKQSTYILNEQQILNIVLTTSSKSEEMVVVTGAFAVKKRDVTGAVSTIYADYLTSLPGIKYESVLQGKVAGLVVQSESNILIRGASSLKNDIQPIYIVDGVIVDDISKLDANSFTNIETLKDAAATALYGARGANGVVIITTGKGGSTIRKDFKDYAIWQPNLTTDKKGKANFEVTYPDNITGWQMYVLAMDGKKRIGQTSKVVTAYKPMVAQLSVPQFLLQGDTAFAIGKIVNYTNESYTVNTFVNDITTKELTLEAQKSSVQNISLVASNKTKLEAKFAMQTTTGFKDAEIRTIPILPVGSTESNGNFWVLDNETTVNYTSQNLANTLTITAQNNTIDVLLEEIENVKNYAYYCMEQTASKLIALQAEAAIRNQLNQKLKYDNVITKLTNKLLKAQLYNGGWNWWGGEKGNANEYITAHILKALLPQKENTLVQNALQNGAMFMHSKLVEQKPLQLIPTLLLLRQLENKNVDYKEYLAKINFDSLQLQEKLQYILVQQLEHLPYEKELNKIMQLKKETILGGMFWSSTNSQWYNDGNSTTVLAYQVLKNSNAKHPNLQNIFQYFLEQKRRGYWMNTYTAANILQTILPEILAATSYKTNPTLQVTGDTTFTINAFPFTQKINNIKQLQFAKQGTGLMYVTAYETYFNTAPTKVDKDFGVTTTLIQKGEPVTTLQANENTKLQLQINCNKEADYVMIELPIPAGCIYNAKNQDYRIVHTEYFKDKVVLFAEKLNIGEHDFSFELQTRYNGTYTLNPSKVSLMYFPTFFGREGLKKLKLKNNLNNWT